MRTRLARYIFAFTELNIVVPCKLSPTPDSMQFLILLDEVHPLFKPDQRIRFTSFPDLKFPHPLVPVFLNDQSGRAGGHYPPRFPSLFPRQEESYPCPGTRTKGRSLMEPQSWWDIDIYGRLDLNWNGFLESVPSK